MRMALLASVLLVGCMGDLPAGGGPGPVQQQPDAGANPNPQPTPDAAPPPVSAAQLLKDWSGCMTLADFQSAKMATQWALSVTDGNKQCQNCHGTGEYGVIITGTEQTFFDMITKHSAYEATYFTVANGKVVIDKGIFDTAGITDASHPRFTPTNLPGMAALQKFYDLTAAHVTNNTCGAPVQVD